LLLPLPPRASIRSAALRFGRFRSCPILPRSMRHSPTRERGSCASRPAPPRLHLTRDGAPRADRALPLRFPRGQTSIRVVWRGAGFAFFRALPFPRSHAAVLAAGALVACGPSLTVVHEGSIRFEHCYRLDLEAEVVPSHREACWKSWLASYAYAQPRDRVDYARQRTQDLAQGDPNPPRLNTGAEHRPEERQFYLVMPSPTSAHAPPAPIATVWRPGQEAELTPAGAPPPAETCADACRGGWAACTDSCQGRARASASGGASPGGADGSAPAAAPVGSGAVPMTSAAGLAACDGCRIEYTACMRRCYE
jgi:hypothetical protein